jgi:hypothetical protein
MLALLEHSPDTYLDEIQQELFTKHDIDISLSTICRTLKRLGMTSKKVGFLLLEPHYQAMLIIGLAFKSCCGVI